MVFSYCKKGGYAYEDIDFGMMATAGNLWWRIPQVTVRQQLGSTELLVSAMKHRRTDVESNERMPWCLARVAQTFGDSNLIAIGGGYQSNAHGQTGKDMDR